MNIFRPVTLLDRPPRMDSDDFVNLPGILAEIAEISGREAAELIAKHRGGSRVYFPPSAALRTDHWIVALVGAERAVMIAKEIADPCGLKVDIPFGPNGPVNQACRSRLALVRSMTLDGASAALIARHLGITDRAVRSIRANLRQTGQLPTKAAKVAQRIASIRASGDRVIPSKVEENIIRLIRSGLSTSQICERMGLDQKVVRNIRSNLTFREFNK